MKLVQKPLLLKSLLKLLKQRLPSTVKNSFWGVFSNILQNLLFSVFFIVVARIYSVQDFATYVMANSIYGIMASFSTMGLGQWFLRSILIASDKQELIGRYFKLQFHLGIIFYLIHLLVCFTLYNDGLLRSLSILIGINLFFDNIIHVIKHLNIAEENQRKTFIVLTVEAFLKALSALFLFLFTFPILYLAVVLILLRLVTLNLFIRYGSSGEFSLELIFRVKTQYRFALNLLRQNWSFVLIGSISVLYWRLGIVFVSKFLTGQDVVDYEVSYKLFSMAEILPFIVSSSVFPTLMKAYNRSKEEGFALYRNLFIAYTLYGMLSFSFIFSYSDTIIPFLFGSNYVGTSFYCKQMFFTILLFPTALLQANMLIVMGLEKTDMWFNMVSLVLHISICFIVLQYIESLSVINFSIFFSFLIFHLLQDILFFQKRILSFVKIAGFYLLVFGFISLFMFSSIYVKGFYLFLLVWLPFMVVIYFKWIRPVLFMHSKSSVLQ